MPVYEKTMKITEATEKILCLCLCTTEKEAKARKEPNIIDIFDKYSYANAYLEYKKSGKKFKQGSVSLFGNGKDQRYVAALFCQYYSGKPWSANDTTKKRMDNLKLALDQLATMPNLESLAFDFGNIVMDNGYSYKDFKELLNDFALKYELNTRKTVTIIFYRDPRYQIHMKLNLLVIRLRQCSNEQQSNLIRKRLLNEKNLTLTISRWEKQY